MNDLSTLFHSEIRQFLRFVGDHFGKEPFKRKGLMNVTPINIQKTLSALFYCFFATPCIYICLYRHILVLKGTDARFPGGGCCL